jgi:hypothetical protein
MSGELLDARGLGRELAELRPVQLLGPLLVSSRGRLGDPLTLPERPSRGDASDSAERDLDEPAPPGARPNPKLGSPDEPEQAKAEKDQSPSDDHLRVDDGRRADSNGRK